MAALIASIQVDRSSVQAGQPVNITLTLTQPASPSQAWTVSRVQPTGTGPGVTVGTPLPLPQTVPNTAGASVTISWVQEFYSGGGNNGTPAIVFNVGATAVMSDGSQVSAPSGCGVTVWPVRYQPPTPPNPSTTPVARASYNAVPPVILPGPGCLFFDSNLNSSLLGALQ